MEAGERLSSTYPGFVRVRHVLPRRSLKACHPRRFRLVFDGEYDTDLVVRYLAGRLLSLGKKLSTRIEPLTFNIGENALPDSVPHAEGVKLCDPTYSQPIPGGTSTTSSSSLSGDAPFRAFICAAWTLSLSIPRIIFISRIRLPIRDPLILPMQASSYLRMHQSRTSFTLGVVEVVPRERLPIPLLSLAEYCPATLWKDNCQLTSIEAPK